MTTTFWSNNPTILFNKNYISQLWASSSFSYEENLNAMSRLVILLSLLGYILTMSPKFLIIEIITLIIIYILYKTQKYKITNSILKEGFNSINSNIPPVLTDSNTNQLITPDTLKPFLKSEFNYTTKKNPLGNVLLTEINDNPHRKSAPPSFNTEVYQDINNSTQKMIQSLNPGIKNTNKQLFGDLGEEFEFDQSQWSFYSTPNTKIPNDQGAFADYLYGNMPSCRDGDAFACVQDNLRYNLY